MKPIYIIEDKKEYITLNGSIIYEGETLNLFFDFFDMIRNTDREYATYDILRMLIEGYISYEEACKYVPSLLLTDNSNAAIWEKTLLDLQDIHDTGKEILESALVEQKNNEESFYKTLFIRESRGIKEAEFFGMFNLRKINYPISHFGTFISECINYLNDSVACCGCCDRCRTFYPIYRGGKAISKNHFCPTCRRTMGSIISKQKKSKESKIYIAYQSFYNRYYQQYKKYNKISYQQFKDYMIIAGKIRDNYMSEGNDDAAAYIAEVEKKIAQYK